MTIRSGQAKRATPEAMHAPPPPLPESHGRVVLGRSTGRAAAAVGGAGVFKLAAEHGLRIRQAGTLRGSCSGICPPMRCRSEEVPPRYSKAKERTVPGPRRYRRPYSSPGTHGRAGQLAAGLGCSPSLPSPPPCARIGQLGRSRSQAHLSHSQASQVAALSLADDARGSVVGSVRAAMSARTELAAGVAVLPYPTGYRVGPAAIGVFLLATSLRAGAGWDLGEKGGGEGARRVSGGQRQHADTGTRGESGTRSSRMRGSGRRGLIGSAWRYCGDAGRRSPAAAAAMDERQGRATKIALRSEGAQQSPSFPSSPMTRPPRLAGRPWGTAAVSVCLVVCCVCGCMHACRVPRVIIGVRASCACSGRDLSQWGRCCSITPSTHIGIYFFNIHLPL